MRGRTKNGAPKLLATTVAAARVIACSITISIPRFTPLWAAPTALRVRSVARATLIVPLRSDPRTSLARPAMASTSWSRPRSSKAPGSNLTASQSGPAGALHVALKRHEGPEERVILA